MKGQEGCFGGSSPGSSQVPPREAGLSGTWRGRCREEKGGNPALGGDKEEGEAGLPAGPLQLGAGESRKGVCALIVTQGLV